MKMLGEKIWRLREGRGLSQEALAEKLEVSRQTISNWENDRATPDAYKLKQLCEALGVGIDALWETETSDPASKEGKAEHPQNGAALPEQKGDRRQGRKIVLLSVLGLVTALFLAVAIVLFALPDGEKTQAITSVLTLTPAMGGVFLLVLAALLLVAVAVILFKRK